jgi:hypothetical protein
MWCENLSALNGQPIHILSYDQLTSRPAAAMRGVFDFLGVGQVPVWSRLVKVSRQSLWQKVSNFEHCVERGIPAAAMLRLPLADDRQSPFSKLAGATTGPRPRPVSAMAG